MAAAWPVSVPDKFIRAGYERSPEDVVTRRQVDAGPPLRFLRAPTRAAVIKGQLNLTLTQAGALETWRRDVLDFGSLPFDFTRRDSGAPVLITCRLAAAPKLLAPKGVMRHVTLELRVDPPAPTPAELSALAALDKASPATWPATVPGCPSRASYETQPAHRFLQSPATAPPVSVLVTRLEGAKEKVTLILTATQLDTFEAWFETSAALGVRDIDFPVPGGVHIGCFSTGYVVRASANRLAWVVSFERYLEAQP